jgi:hypothetical protein
MGEELELGNLFIVCDDGTYVPFEGIKPADIICTDEMDEELYNSLPKEGTIELKFDMKRHDYRKSMKKLKAQINGYRRRKRYAIRQKERDRRRALRHGR